MSKWTDKTIIGLTGNIATGKSVVRKMLEHLGAYGIDADALSHRAIARGAPGYKPVVETFGKWILKPDAEIDRARLGRIVFNDPAAMLQLESIIHPLVRQALEFLIQRTRQKVVVIEAIKLLQGDLVNMCDSIWVVTVPQEKQITRLMEKRQMSLQDALQRVQFQEEQAQKVKRAQVVIENKGSFEETWKRVNEAWKKITPAETEAPASPPIQGEFGVLRGRPRDSVAIAELITRLSGGQQSLTREDVMAAFGEKAFMLLQFGGKNVGIAGWQVENLVARTTEFYIDPQVELEKGLKILVREVERASLDLQCEASLLFLNPGMAAKKETWKELGYESRKEGSLGVSAWNEAARESARPDTELFFKQLRVDRVLRPI